VPGIIIEDSVLLKLNEVGCQLELWADELEEIGTAETRKASKPEKEAGPKRRQIRSTREDARTHS